MDAQGYDNDREARRAARRERRRQRDLDGSRTARIGAVLVIIGALALLSDLGVFSGAHNVVGMLLFAVLGVLALGHFLTRGRPYSLLGAFALFGLAAATVGGGSAGFYFLGLLGVGFLALYYVDRERWWAIIPGGTLVSLAFVAGLDSWRPGYDPTWVLFLGLGLTFGVLTRLPGDPKSWAIFPAVASLLIAVLGFSFGGGWLVPLVLVGVGVYLLLSGERGGWRQALGGGAAGKRPPAGRPDGAPGDGAAAGGSDTAGGAAEPPGDPEREHGQDG